MAECIICGRSLKTGRKYCYMHRNYHDSSMISKKRLTWFNIVLDSFMYLIILLLILAPTGFAIYSLFWYLIIEWNSSYFLFSLIGSIATIGLSYFFISRVIKPFLRNIKRKYSGEDVWIYKRRRENRSYGRHRGRHGQANIQKGIDTLQDLV